MTNLESTIEEIVKDLKPDDIPRGLYLSLCVKDRLEKQTEVFNEQFDKIIETIEKEDRFENDLSVKMNRLISLSNLFIRTYDRLISDFDKFQNYLQNFK